MGEGEGALEKTGTAPPAPWNCLGPDLKHSGQSTPNRQTQEL